MAFSDEPSSYDPVQQLFALNIMANAAAKYKGPRETLEAVFEVIVNKHLPNLAGGWELAWGPVVYKARAGADTNPTNVWCVATSQSQKRSVIAIAGTAAGSIEGWLQDFEVQRVVDWNDWVSHWTPKGIADLPGKNPKIDQKRPYIARGTAKGVANVLGMKSGRIRSGTTCHEYLQTLESDFEIFVTGHSMGGALSPVVALGLVQANMVSGRKVTALPSAGASPGNVAFADLWKSHFPAPPTSSSMVNLNWFNTQDLVPQAWCIDSAQDRNVDNIRGSIYEGSQLFVLVAAANIIRSRSKRSGIKYVGLPGHPFTSETPVKNPITTREQLGESIRDQHVDAYTKKLQVKGWWDLIQEELKHSIGIREIPDISIEDEAALTALLDHPDDDQPEV